MDLAVIPLVAVLSVPGLLWFGDHPWAVLGKDAPRYLFAGSELVSGGGLDSLAGLSNYNGGHGPVFPALIGGLMLVFGRDTEILVWAMRLTALLNPPLAYFVAKRLSGPPAGLLAAALLTLFGFNVQSTFVLNIDVLLLTFYLSAILALLAAVKRENSSPLLALLSGMLLGASVLTKETAVANLPLALLAVLLLGWPLRAALWHYLGVALVCLPWWAWRWAATGEVYLLDRLPPPLELPISVATAILLCLAGVACASGMVSRFLAGERRWTGWSVAVAWTVSLSALMLATTGPALAEASPEAVVPYLAEVLTPPAFVVPVVLVTAGYAVWRALRGDGPWKLLALALLFQVPICLFVVVMGWDPRQFLVAQALLFCALASLVVGAGGAAWRGRGYPARLAGALVAVPLVVFVLVASAQTVRATLPEDPAEAFGQHEAAPQASGMIGWTDGHVPAGERILVNPAQGNYLAYLDGGRHEWGFLRLDQEQCVSKPNIQMECAPREGAISRIPRGAVWVQSKGGCEVISLSMPNLLEQARETGSGYVMITGSSKFPGILGLPPVLQGSGAFEVVRTEGGQSARGVALLKTTGRAPGAVPTLMNQDTVAALERCAETQGRSYSNWLRSEFPDGIFRVTTSG